MYKILKLTTLGEFFDIVIKTKDVYMFAEFTPELIKKLEDLLFLSGIKVKSIDIEKYVSYSKRYKLNFFKDMPEKLNRLMKIDISSDDDIFSPEDFDEYIWQGVEWRVYG